MTVIKYAIAYGLILKGMNMYYYGVHGRATDWIKDYLLNRKQFVSTDGCGSELLDVTRGVLQGSILWLRLFVLYINDICYVSSIVKFIILLVI